MEQSTEEATFYPTDIDEAGGVLLPDELRQLLNIKIGDKVAWAKSASGLRLITVHDKEWQVVRIS